jgi:lysine-N-methylase
MILEYPEYYERFRCIGGDCPDTCCAGWEVDVDRESLQYYKTVEGDFGKRLKNHLCEEDEDGYFPLTKDKRCPFLNKENLCDIYINLGEESLCQTCTEYPRYFIDAGNYEQTDMSLSCMELGRIFYKETPVIEYVRSENPVEGDPVSEEDQETLIEVLALRNKCISLLQDTDHSFTEKLREVRALVSCAEGEDPEEKDKSRVFLRESYKELMVLFGSLDSINEEWSRKLSSYKVLSDTPSALEKIPDFLSRCSEKLNEWIPKTGIYFIFRYFIDTLTDGDIEYELCFVHRSLRLIFFMLFAEWLNKGDIDVTDIIYAAHLYSKEVEHDDGNVARIKKSV